ncbi:histidine phosphatase family protein [Streptococcus ovuberis]|uniref:Histidine phosphatase family protein n=1 Tax=Streptococcus ovuberis TaxID=1936207 RepID=A0A7X6S1C3_9STRE|nr:histidine phosphatase family protein [Streptococcus ovuberis]NKZ21019.1 histidine phosphatase family protein [Streptococcus ovuberis]
MEILFIRHSEPDYSMLDKASHPEAYAGFGRDLAPLTVRGRTLAQQAAQSTLLDDVDAVISSSITRALETATYLVRNRQLELLVEPFFHEWRPDLEGLNYTEVELDLAYRLFMENSGALIENSPVRYETAHAVKTRFLKALQKYKAYDKVAIVSHGMLIRQFVPMDTIDYCQMIPYTIDLESIEIEDERHR